MSERLRSQLGSLLDRYDAARREADSRMRQARVDDALFLQHFAELRRDVVRPVFEAAGALLHERGHEFSIIEEEYQLQGGGKSIEATIELRIAPFGMEKLPQAHDHLRALSFATRHYNKTVCITNGAVPQSGSIAGAAGSYALSQIDAQLVEQELLKLVAALVKA